MTCSDCREPIDTNETIHHCMARRSNWREYTIRASFGQVDVFLAPSLDYAFALARCMWPTARSWTCLGSVVRADRKEGTP